MGRFWETVEPTPCASVDYVDYSNYNQDLVKLYPRVKIFAIESVGMGARNNPILGRENCCICWGYQTMKTSLLLGTVEPMSHVSVD